MIFRDEKMKMKSLRIALSAALILSPFPVFGSGIQVSQIESQPNLMILLSNSASMSLNMAGTGYATEANSSTPVQNQCAANYSSSSDYIPAQTFDDGSSGACNGQGTYYQYGIYGNLTGSRFYIAKQTLYNLLKQGYANSINLGFATYRQAMGMELTTVAASSNAEYPNIYFNGQTPGEQSTFPYPYNQYTPVQLSQVGNNPLNFGFLDWYSIYNPYFNNNSGDEDAFIGNYPNNPYNSDALFGSVTYLNGNNGGGLPYQFSYPQGTLQNYTIPSGPYAGAYYGAAGLTPQQKQNNTPELVLQLCQTYYNSQNNSFQAIYTANNSNGAPEPFIQTFPSKYNGNTRYYVTLGSNLFQNGFVGSSYSQPCNVAQTPSGSTANSSVEISSGYNFITNQFSNGQPAYFDYIPNYLSGTANDGGAGDVLNGGNGLNPGQADGWSGATTVNANGVISAQYPSTPQPESIIGQWNESGAKWMGTFVNLPSPQNPVNNVQTIENLVNPNYPMENPSGLDYHYSTQTIVNSSGENRSIVNSTESPSYNPNQEPLADSLADAIAYWKAFENTDKQAQCQNNNMLIIYDGISDGDTNISEEQEEQNLISYAKTLYNTYGVKIYVVIISENPGDITEANALAAAGGTGTAYNVTNSSQLYNDLQSVLLDVSSESISSRFGNTPSTTVGDYTFAPVTVSQDTGQGDLAAYEVLPSGGLNNPTSLTPSFDANQVMSGRTGNYLYSTNFNQPSSSSTALFSSGSESTISNLAANDPNDFGNPSNPTPSTIAQYTINPSYDNGKYLGGRQSGWTLGLPSGSAPVVITPPDNGELLDNPSNGYTNFAKNHANRSNAVLFSANDGFLYAMKYSNSSNPQPSMMWAWMPQGILSQLQNYNTFWQSGSMQGGFTEVDANNNSGIWHSYVVGSALSGGILYDLQLSGTSQPNLSKTVAEYDLNSNGSTYTQVVLGKPTIQQNTQTGITYAAWSVNSTSGSGATSSGIFLMNVATGAMTFLESPTNLTSMPIFDSQGNLYVASGSTIYTISAANVSAAESKARSGGNYPTETGLFQSLITISAPSNAQNGTSTSIDYLQLSSLNGENWITAESQNAIWALQDGLNGWSMVWFSGIKDSAVYKNNGWTNPPANDPIVDIPVGGTITNPALIANGSVILPISVRNPNSSVCSLPTAEYNLYQLSNGGNPSGKFVTIQGQSITDANLIIGYGNAYTPSISIMNGKALIQSSASNTGKSGNFPAANSSGLPLGGPIQADIAYPGQLQ